MGWQVGLSRQPAALAEPQSLAGGVKRVKHWPKVPCSKGGTPLGSLSVMGLPSGDGGTSLPGPNVLGGLSEQSRRVAQSLAVSCSQGFCAAMRGGVRQPL